MERSSPRMAVRLLFFLVNFVLDKWLGSFYNKRKRI